MEIGNTDSAPILNALEANKGLADRAIAQVPHDKLRVAIDPHTNSLAVIIKHIAGNLLSRWTDFLNSDGEKPWRDRDSEFVDTFQSRAEILDYWEKGWNCVFAAIRSIISEDHVKTITIRVEPQSLPLALERSLGHTCYHVGQIVILARHLSGDNWDTLTIPRSQSQQYNQQHLESPTKPVA